MDPTTAAPGARAGTHLSNVKNLHECHKSVLERIRAVEKVVLNHENAESPERLELREHKCREMVYLYQEVDEELPKADAETLFFGYKIADDGLRQWQNHARQAEKEAVAKRKQENEAGGESPRRRRESESEANWVPHGCWEAGESSRDDFLLLNWSSRVFDDSPVW